jgi:hypothetical protein
LVDSTDLIIITSVVQTVVISLTLLVFIFQFRSQEKAIKESAVQNVMGRYTDYIGMLVERPELSKLLDFDEAMNPPEGGSTQKLSQEEQTLSAYLLLGYGALRRGVFASQEKVDGRGDVAAVVGLPRADDQAADFRTHPQGHTRDIRQGVPGLRLEAHRERPLRSML